MTFEDCIFKYYFKLAFIAGDETSYGVF